MLSHSRVCSPADAQRARVTPMHPAHPLMRAGRQQRVAAAAEPRPQQADAPPRMDVDPAALLARDWMDVKALYKNMVSKEAKKAAETRLAAERKAAAAAAQAKQQAAALARQQAASKAAKEAQRQKSAAGRNGAGPAAAAKAGASSDRKPSQTGSSKPSPEPSTSGSGSSSSPAAAAVPGFKGFGAAPPAAVAAAEAAANPRALKVFRHAVDLDRVQGAISGNSWQNRVLVVDDIRQADAVIAVKLTRGGAHINHDQARRAAANAGIPLVVVGRQMTKDSLAAALTPLLQQKQAAGRAKAQE